MARMMSLRLLSKCIITCQCPDETPFLLEEATGNFEDIYLEIDYLLATYFWNRWSRLKENYLFCNCCNWFPSSSIGIADTTATKTSKASITFIVAFYFNNDYSKGRAMSNWILSAFAMYSCSTLREKKAGWGPSKQGKTCWHFTNHVDDTICYRIGCYQFIMSRMSVIQEN